MREAQGLLWCGGGRVVRGGVVRMNQGGPSCGLAELPLVGEPGVEIPRRPGGQVQQQLREVELRIDLVPAAGGGQARQDGGGAAAARVAHEQRVLATTERFP